MTIFNGLGIDSVADAPGGVLSGFSQRSGLPSLAQLQDGTADTINGNGGNDRIFAGSGGDTINGGDGNDVISGMLGLDAMDGGAGIDTHDVRFYAFTYDWNMATSVTNFADETAINFENALLGAGNDTVTGNALNNIIDGGAGNDALDGGAGRDTLLANSGNDILRGGLGIDAVSGGGGNDLILGGTSQDNLFGDAGNDIVRVLDGEWADNVNGGTGSDLLDLSLIANRFAVLSLTTGTYRLEGYGPSNSITQIENVYGTQLADRITGDALANLLRGNGGNDELKGQGGDDGIYGHDGDDLVYGGDGNDLVTGGNGEDNLQGFSGNDILLGGNENDVVNASAGNDLVNGGGGADLVYGGTDNDIFLFDTALTVVNNVATNVDRMPDFSSAQDTVQLDNAIFTKLPPGTLAANAFRRHPVAVDFDDRIIYGTGGYIYYDPTGVQFGASDQIPFARVTIGTHVTAADFVVV